MTTASADSGSRRSRCTSSTDPTRRCPTKTRSARSSSCKAQGKIRHIGLSNVDESQLRVAQSLAPIVSIQNRYNLADRHSESLLDLCEQESIAFLPWAPVQDADANPALQDAATRHGATTTQIVLAWLLARSAAMVPIPGTGSVAHLEENMAAAGIELDAGEVPRSAPRPGDPTAGSGEWSRKAGVAAFFSGWRRR